jgi:cellulose synthase/poly-beta-1,6-N-acetylglucosamine synthase-like glycosyltransferase
MSFLLWAALASPLVIGLYAYVLYPAALRLLPPRRASSPAGEPRVWPLVSVSLPARNEARQIRGALDALLASDYPPDRLQIVVVSDASDDGTDEIVREYAGRGVDLLRLEQRGGKTAAEQAAVERLRGEIVVNTDASIRVEPGAIRNLVAAFADPEVGVASGRDISISAQPGDRNGSEAAYVGYEMAVRGLETRATGIVGASGCLYAIRAELHHHRLPEHLSRDFASALTAREHGFRSVSVESALCLVPRTDSLRREYRRKVRTIARGLQTLWYKRHLLNPLRYGVFAWMLWSHKVGRWAVPPSLVLATIALLIMAWSSAWARTALALLLVGLALVALGAWRPARAPRLITSLASAAAANLAVIHALAIVPFEQSPTWEPTRREPVLPAGGTEASPHPARAANSVYA